jgi:hypothetical protein
VTATRPPLPTNDVVHDQVIAGLRQPDSATQGATGTAVAGATGTADAVASIVGLVAEQVEVDEVDTKATPADATLATRHYQCCTATSRYGPATAPRAGRRSQQSSVRQTSIPLGKVMPGDPGLEHLIGGSADSVNS